MDPGLLNFGTNEGQLSPSANFSLAEPKADMSSHDLGEDSEVTDNEPSVQDDEDEEDEASGLEPPKSTFYDEDMEFETLVLSRGRRLSVGRL